MFKESEPRDSSGKWAKVPGYILKKAESNIPLLMKNDRLLIDGKDVGTLKLGPVENGTIEIKSLFLNDNVQKKGIGRQVLDELLSRENIHTVKVYPLGTAEPYWARFAHSVNSDGDMFISKQSFEDGLKKHFSK